MFPTDRAGRCLPKLSTPPPEPIKVVELDTEALDLQAVVDTLRRELRELRVENRVKDKALHEARDYLDGGTRAAANRATPHLDPTAKALAHWPGLVDVFNLPEWAGRSRALVLATLGDAAERIGDLEEERAQVERYLRPAWTHACAAGDPYAEAPGLKQVAKELAATVWCDDATPTRDDNVDAALHSDNL